MDTTLLSSIMPAIFGMLGVMTGAFVQYISEERKRTHDDKKDLEKRIHNEKKDIMKKRGELYSEFLKKLGESIAMLSSPELVKALANPEEGALYITSLLNLQRNMHYTVSEIILFANVEIGLKCKELCWDYLKAIWAVESGLVEPKEVMLKLPELLYKLGNSQRELEFDMNKDLALFSDEELKKVPKREEVKKLVSILEVNT